MQIGAIGLLYNPRVPAAQPLVEQIAGWLALQGVRAWRCSTHEPLPGEACLPETDLLLTLGGDGTILRAVQRSAPLGIPVLGLNLGRVGFLTEGEPEAWPQLLEAVLAGRGEVEERLMLEATLHREGVRIAAELALNDAVISRGSLARTVHLEAHIDGAPLTTFIADGLILATATGSTAYSYAVGGPILPPWIDNFLLVPVAAHLTLNRPLVLNADATVEIVVHTGEPGMLTVDGRLADELHDGDRVRVRRSPVKGRFLRLRQRGDFYQTLVERLTPHNEVKS